MALSLAEILANKQKLAQPAAKSSTATGLPSANLAVILAARSKTGEAPKALAAYAPPTKFPAKELLRWFYGCYYHQFYVEHYRELRLIAEWLRPLDWPIPSRPPTRFLYSYDVMCLTDILGGSVSQIQECMRQLMEEGFYGPYP